MDDPRVAGQGLVAQPGRRHGGEVGPRAVADQGDPVGADPGPGADVLRVRGHPPHRLQAVLEPGGERVLRRQPVADGDDDGREGLGEGGHPPGRLLDVAQHPAAAVQVDDDRQAPGTVPGAGPGRVAAAAA